MEWWAKSEVTELHRPWIGHLSQKIWDFKNWYQDYSNERDFCNQSRKSIFFLALVWKTCGITLVSAICSFFCPSFPVLSPASLVVMLALHPSVQHSVVSRGEWVVRLQNMFHFSSSPGGRQRGDGEQAVSCPCLPNPLPLTFCPGNESGCSDAYGRQLLHMGRGQQECVSSRIPAPDRQSVLWHHCSTHMCVCALGYIWV